jgi:hypothetical protein
MMFYACKAVSFFYIDTINVFKTLKVGEYVEAVFWNRFDGGALRPVPLLVSNQQSAY